MSGSEEPIRKRRKVSLACGACRERKIRCSGEKPTCASCHRRSEECSYVVRLESILGASESIQSVLDRLKRLESLGQSGIASAQEQNTSQSDNTGAGSQTHLALNSGDRGIPSTNVQQPLERISRPSLIYDGCPADSQNLQHVSSNTSQSAPVDGTEPEWKTEEYGTPHGLVQAVSNEADAMGASSVCDKDSPQDSAQYYGDSSGIGFMRAIRHVLGETSRDGTIHNMTSTDRANQAGLKQDVGSELLKLIPTFEGTKFSPELFTLPSRALSDALLEKYWTRVYPLYPFIHRPTFEAAYATIWNPSGSEAHLAQESDAGLGNIIDAGPSSQTFYCALNMMLALGTQFLDISVSQRSNIIAMFEQRSKNLLVVDMMDRGSIAIVQALLLNGQYCQSTYLPQRCWNCIGVGCRIAQGLGLHVDQSPVQKSSLGQEMRRRVWYACLMFDMSGSMTMGRPLMILHKFSTSPPSPLDDETLQPQSVNMPVIGAFLEGIKLSETLGIILTTIYDQHISNKNSSSSSPKTIQGSTEIDAILELDKKLGKFQSELPVELRRDQEGEELRRSLGPTVGNLEMQSNALHARFLQSRILLYRTTFIRFVQDSVSKMNDLSSDNYTDPEVDVDSFFMTRCAVSCVTSARELIALIHLTFQSASSDAWWYNVYYAHTAGMVVKFAQTCSILKKVINVSHLDQSWALCCETLSKMSWYGRVPRRCLESLEAMQEKVSRLELANSKSRSQFSQQGNMHSEESRLPNSQEAIALNGAGGTQVLQGPGGTQPQVADHFADAELLMGNSIPTSKTPLLTDSNDKNYHNWSTEFMNMWSFPVDDFGFDEMAFV